MKLENDSKWLFKYMPFNLNAVKLLANNELWFGKPDTLNDPNEVEFILSNPDNVDEVLDFQISIQDELDSTIKINDSGVISPIGSERIEFERQLKKVIRDYLGICSMSVNYDDILMWAHYSDYNYGICVVFDKEILTNNFRGLKAEKVTYSPDISKAYFCKSGNIGQLFADKIFYMEKLDNWTAEGEFRFVKRYQDRISQNKTDRLVRFPEDAIKGIILGEKFPVHNFKTLINLVYSRNTEKKFNFWKCTKNIYKKSMDIRLITGRSSIYSNQNDYIFEDILDNTKNRIVADKKNKN